MTKQVFISKVEEFKAEIKRDMENPRCIGRHLDNAEANMLIAGDIIDFVNSDPISRSGNNLCGDYASDATNAMSIKRLSALVEKMKRCQ